MRLAAGDPRHGSYYAYASLGCRCDECRRAMRDYKRVQRTGTSEDPELVVRGARIQVTCWCEAKVVHVPREAFRAGLTESCGRHACTPDLVGAV